MAPSRGLGDFRVQGTYPLSVRDGLFVKSYRPPAASGRPRRRTCVLAGCILIYVIGVLLLSAAGPASDREHRNKYPESVAPAAAAAAAVASAAAAASSRGRLHWCGPLRFLPDDRPRPITALVSYPGSGNTWLRYLLQQATGIHTGSIYKDYGLMKNGFPAEKVRNGSVLAVKTHEWGPSGRSGFHRAVLLVRQPAGAILAEFNRQSGGHIGVAALDRFQLKQGRMWRQFVRSELTAWRALNLDWLTNFTGPTHVVLYENLVSDTESVLRAALAFLEVSVPDVQLDCALRRKEGIYRRRKRNIPPGFDPFTADMRAALSVVENSVMSRVREFMTLSAPD